MAEHILETRIQLRYGTYTQWMNSSLVLKRGEAAVCSFPRSQTIEDMSNSEPDNTPPAIGIKIGDGVSYFRELPWVQAIAADVYNWAKSYTKPTYTASEIQGLGAFIENYSSGSGTGGSGNITPRIYKIIEGTGDNAHKFYLQYTEDIENGPWITDTNSYIDLTDLAEVYNWIGTYNLTEFPNLSTRINSMIGTRIETLDSTDSAVTHQFITSVNEVDGIISVERARPAFDDISGILPLSQGGIGLTSVAEDHILIGTGLGTFTTRQIATEIANNNHIVPNYLIKAYVDSAVAGIEGAMHYIGDATVEPRGATNPQISGYTFANAQPGDVVLWEYKEYVWTGGSWRLLGDEGSYAVKGSIKDADIDAEANIQQSKIAGLADTFNTKVDKVPDKGLSTNDYTTEEKLKLAGIDDGAQVNVIESISLNGNAQTILNKNVNLVVREYPTADEQKLAGIATGAQVNVIEQIYYNGREVAPDQQFKRVSLWETISGIVVDGETLTPNADRIVSFTTTHDQYENKIEHILYDNQEVTIDANTRTAKIYSDPHTEHENVIESIIFDGTTVPISNKVATITPDYTPYENIIESIAINGVTVNPVDKQVDLLLDTLYSAQLTKLARIASGAQVNVIENILYDGQTVESRAQDKTAIITSDPHTEHENVIERIYLNNVLQTPDEDKYVHLSITEQSLGLNLLKGAVVPNGSSYSDVAINADNKLVFAAIAESGNVNNLLQDVNTYIIIDCGTSTEVMD